MALSIYKIPILVMMKVVHNIQVNKNILSEKVGGI